MKNFFCLAVVLISSTCFGQDIQVNRQNKTIAVTADESITADAEVAVLAIGFHNYALTQEAAYRENVRAAEKIVEALMEAKVAAGNVETDKLNLTHVEPDQRWTEEMKRQRVFEAEQSWHISVSAAQAQDVVDMAVRAGANEVDDVEWNVVDAVALQAKASGAALAKARAIAEQMAKGLGTKVGELVYASNRAPVPKMWRGLTTTVSASMASVRQEEPKLKLFPQKVRSEATVYAVFAIE
jgi:uncharacterized protein